MKPYEAMKASCAALAFHKALIGLSQLDALELASGQMSDLYGARGIYTYYVVYHLFCSCMLIAPEIYTDGKLKAPSQYGKTPEEEINSPSETPKQWEKGREYEADWATKITHSQVKDFCKNLRCSEKADWGTELPYLIPLYDYFINDTGSENQCIPALYEKLCYVRDRIIYRPSYVPVSSGNIVQTSAQLGEEVRSLPGAEYLYKAISEIYRKLLVCMETEREKGGHGVYIAMFAEMWAGRVNEKDLKALCSIGHKKSRLQRLGQRDDEGEYSFPTYISHLLETETIDFVRKYHKKYWKPLENIYKLSWSDWRESRRKILTN